MKSSWIVLVAHRNPTADHAVPIVVALPPNRLLLYCICIRYVVRLEDCGRSKARWLASRRSSRKIQRDLPPSVDSISAGPTPVMTSTVSLSRRNPPRSRLAPSCRCPSATPTPPGRGRVPAKTLAGAAMMTVVSTQPHCAVGACASRPGV